MDLKRFFVENIVGNTATLIGEEFFHAIKVTRHKVGYNIILCDNTGYDYYGTITEINKDNLIVAIDKKEQNNTELINKVNLFIGVNKDIDSVVQKAVELGISCVTPFFSQHTNLSDVNVSRLQKIVLESSKQCGRAKLMEIKQAENIDILMEKFDSNTLVFYEYERDNKVSESKISHENPINIVIGGEGGFSLDEISKIKDKGAQTLTLGNRILRVSTAVVSAITLTLQRIGEM